jgi:hypothetical protein
MNAKLVTITSLLGVLSSCEKTSTSSKGKQSESQPASATGTAALPETAARQAEALDIYEVTFRYLFQKNASGQQQKAGAYFIHIGDELKMADPDDGFMKRFADVKPPVKRYSECESSMERGVVEKSTGVKGLSFGVGKLKWISDTEVEISGGYYEAGLSSAGYTYRLKKTSGKWAVEKETMTFIS